MMIDSWCSNIFNILYIIHIFGATSKRCAGKIIKYFKEVIYIQGTIFTFFGYNKQVIKERNRKEKKRDLDRQI